MRPTVDELRNSGRYQLIESFRIDDMPLFIQRELCSAPLAQQLAKCGWKSWLALLGFSLLGAAVGYFSTTYLFKGGTKFSGEVILGVFVLLAIHEFIHGLAFKYVGAPNVGYGYSAKSLMVYAYSQCFPATLREVAFVAVMPFLVITTGLIAGMIGLPAYRAAWAVLLLIHSIGCIGDFALIRYWYRNRLRTIYTYDDVENEYTTYFFEQVRQPD